MAGWWNGRHASLRNQCLWRAGSNPVPATCGCGEMAEAIIDGINANSSPMKVNGYFRWEGDVRGIQNP